MSRILAPIVLMAAAVPTAAHADTLQAELLARMRGAARDDLAFRRTIMSEGTGQQRRVIVEQYDPRRPAAARWTLVSIDGKPATPKQQAAAARRQRDTAPDYARLAEWFGGAASRWEAGPGRAVYRFARLPAGTVKVGSHDASADTRAEAVVNLTAPVPFVERVRFISTKPFRMMLVAAVQSLTLDARYRLAGDGTVVPLDNDAVFTGSLMGRSGQLRTRADYAEVTRVR